MHSPINQRNRSSSVLPCIGCCKSQIIHQAFDFRVFSSRLGHAQNSRRVNSGGDWAARGIENLAAMLGEAKIRAEQILSGGRPQTNDDSGTDRIDLLVQPWAAGDDFEGIGLLVQPSFTARFPFEMLHRVGYIDVTAVDTGRLQALMKQLACRTNKRFSLQIFTIAGLFAHQKYIGVRISLPENDLRGLLVQIAPTTVFGGGAQAVKIWLRR